MKYITDGKRHLICIPYSVPNLHRMAEDLGIKRCWFHGTNGLAHYDIPKRRLEEITSRCEIVTSKKIVEIIKSSGTLQ